MKYLTSKMVADYVGMSASHIRRLLKQGAIVAEKLGHDYIVQEKDIKLFLKHHKQRKSKRMINANGAG